jgi:hypothetical protein
VSVGLNAWGVPSTALKAVGVVKEALRVGVGIEATPAEVAGLNTIRYMSVSLGVIIN